MRRVLHKSLTCLLLSLSGAIGGCGGDPPIEREWRAEDHGQPQNADPARTPRQADPAETPEQARARAAAALWNVSCAGCHGREGRGDGASKPPGAHLADFADPAWQASQSDEALATVIAEGRNLMPAFADKINPEGISALVAHLRTLKAAGPPP